MPVIEVDRMHKRYGERIAVHDVSFEVGEGKIFGILGPNGAGKTTTVECIEGLRSPDGGTISVLGGWARRSRATRSASWRRSWSARRRCSRSAW